MWKSITEFGKTEAEIDQIIEDLWKEDSKPQTCHDCGVEPNQNHLRGCDVERCSKCKGQRISCGCTTEQVSEVWTGIWPGTVECKELRLVTTFDEGKTWSFDYNELARRGLH